MGPVLKNSAGFVSKSSGFSFERITGFASEDVRSCCSQNVPPFTLKKWLSNSPSLEFRTVRHLTSQKVATSPHFSKDGSFNLTSPRVVFSPLKKLSLHLTSRKLGHFTSPFRKSVTSPHLWKAGSLTIPFPDSVTSPPLSKWLTSPHLSTAC
jgi:hypothetical protein